mgnify:CR=1 FL=1
MKNYYEKRINEFSAIAQELELKAEKEMRSGSGAQAMEYCKQADMAKEEANKWREALKGMAA